MYFTKKQHKHRFGHNASLIIEKNKYSIVITDYYLGTLDGDALCRKVRQISPETAVFFVTGLPDVANTLPPDSTPDLVIGKPVDCDEINSIVSNFLEIQSRNKTAQIGTSLRKTQAMSLSNSVICLPTTALILKYTQINL